MLSNSDNMLGCDYMCSKYIETLSELEKVVIVALAEKGPMTGYDFHLGGKRQRGSRKAIMSSGYWLKVREHLGADLGFIKRVNLRRHKANDRRGRRKDLYWLTEEGIISAALNHASLRRLRQNTRRVYGKTENYEAFYDMAEIVGATKLKGIVEISKQYKTQAQMPDYLVVAPSMLVDNGIQLKTVAECIKKYPNVKKVYENRSQRARAELEKIEGYLRG